MNSAVESLEPYPQALALAVLARYEAWLGQRVVMIAAQSSVNIDEATQLALTQHVHAARVSLEHELCELLSTEVDEQRKNPLHVIRESTITMNEFLKSVGVPAPHRDEFETRAMPHDVYAIGPLTWRDLGDDVHEAGIEWGAWKAATVLTRRRAEGKLDQ